MSIVRMGEDGSNVYIIGTTSGWECVGCALKGSFQPYNDDLTTFFEHLQQHRLAGDCVPDWVENKIASWTK